METGGYFYAPSALPTRKRTLAHIEKEVPWAPRAGLNVLEKTKISCPTWISNLAIQIAAESL
jgi:hypothetical protein